MSDNHEESPRGSPQRNGAKEGDSLPASNKIAQDEVDRNSDGEALSSAEGGVDFMLPFDVQSFLALHSPKRQEMASAQNENVVVRSAGSGDLRNTATEATIAEAAGTHPAQSESTSADENGDSNMTSPQDSVRSTAEPTDTGFMQHLPPSVSEQLGFPTTDEK